MKRWVLGIFLAGWGGLGWADGPGRRTFSITYAPTAVLRYRGEGKILPEGYVNRAERQRAPLYLLEWTQVPVPEGYWGLSLWHTGVFGGGEFAPERLPKAAGGTYQTNLLNTGFTNFFVTHHRSLAESPVELELSVSIVREIFKRKQFVVEGVPAPGLDDVNEISAEGLGVGLSGTHGRRLYARWRTAAHYYVQLFDAKTDASAGQIFQAEGGFGWRFKTFSVETGGLWQTWFILGQGNRRLAVTGTDGAVISYNRQNTSLSGMYLKLNTTF